MNDLPGSIAYFLCPLCEGKGQLQGHDLAERLNDQNLQAKLAECRENLRERIERRRSERVKVGAEPEKSSFEQQVRNGPLTQMLWRRSPKE